MDAAAPVSGIFQSPRGGRPLAASPPGTAFGVKDAAGERSDPLTPCDRSGHITDGSHAPGSSGRVDLVCDGVAGFTCALYQEGRTPADKWPAKLSTPSAIP